MRTVGIFSADVRFSLASHESVHPQLRNAPILESIGADVTAAQAFQNGVPPSPVFGKLEARQL